MKEGLMNKVPKVWNSWAWGETTNGTEDNQNPYTIEINMMVINPSWTLETP
jgi:hypothetical protein